MRALVPLLLVLAGCGGLDNGPLRVGEVKGQLSKAVVGKAFAAVYGSPETRIDVEASGAFALKGLPPGALELIVVDGESQGARVAVQLEAASVVDLGVVGLFPSGELEVVAKAPDHQRLSEETLSLVGTPWQRVGVNGDGRLEVSDVPRGCWQVMLAVKGLSATTREICLDEGEAKRVDVDLPSADGTAGAEGCRVTGCESGYFCDSDGACR